MIKKLLILTAATICFSSFGRAQQGAPLAVTLKTPDGRYVGITPEGGLDAEGTAVTPKQTFLLVDLNGGKVADGDRVKFLYEGSQWREDGEKSLIHRAPSRVAKEEECVFKLHVRDRLLYLETPAGKFVRIENRRVLTTGEVKDATLFDIQAAAPAEPPTSYSVAFRFASGGLLGMVANGGLDATAKEITANQIFTMIDLNGGNLSSGDRVKLVFGQSQMREDREAGRIHRVPIRGAKEEECIFRIVVNGENVLLQAPSGRFVAAAADGKSIVTTDKKDETSLLTAVPNPAPAATGK